MRDVRGGVKWGPDMGGWCDGVGVADNKLGAEGGRAVVEGLKHNSTLTTLGLSGETPLPPLFVVLVGGGCGCGVLLAWVVGVVGGLWVEWEQMCDYH